MKLQAPVHHAEKMACWFQVVSLYWPLQIRDFPDREEDVAYQADES